MSEGFSNEVEVRTIYRLAVLMMIIDYDASDDDTECVPAYIGPNVK